MFPKLYPEQVFQIQVFSGAATGLASTSVSKPDLQLTCLLDLCGCCQKRFLLTMMWQIYSQPSMCNLCVPTKEMFHTKSDVQWGSEIGTFEIQKHLKCRVFEGQISNGFWQKWQPFVCISNGWLQDFRSHSKSGPFATQPIFNHSKSRLVQISDPHCILTIFRMLFPGVLVLHLVNNVTFNHFGHPTQGRS